MRKKIGKRIGPVPIALVAVFALAAFISVGLLLTVPNGQTVQAQGLPDIPSATAGTKCTVTVFVVRDTDDATDTRPAAALRGMVSGGGCVASGDSVDVIFENEDGANVNTADDMQRIAVYITGGEDFPDVQATNYVVDEGGVDSIVNLGKKGVDEEFLIIDEADQGPGGISRPGSETITVNRSMAKDGQVYLFGYFATDTWGFTTGINADAGIPLGVFVDDDDRSTMFESNALLLVGDALVQANAAIDAATNEMYGLTTAATPATASFTAESLPNVVAETDDPDSTDDEQESVSNARTRINMIKGHVKYVSAEVVLKDLVIVAELAIMEAQAAIDGIEDGDPKHFMNQEADFVVKVDFRDAAVAAKLVKGEYKPNELEGTSGSVMFTGTTASDGPTKVLPNADDEADVYLAFRDENGVALAGFVQLTIDASVSGGADATFVGSNRTIQRVKLGEDIDDNMIKDPGEAVVKVQGLPENDAIRIPITADFNDGELVLEGYITREGDAEMVSATAYICERDDTDKQVSPMTTPKTYIEPAMVETEDACNTEIGALSTPGTSDDPTEVAALGPLAIFFIGAEAKDSVGNTVSEKAELSWSVTEDTDNEADAKTAIDGADSGDTNTAIMIAGIDDAKPGTYSITVTDQDGDASTTLEITVSAEATRISVACEPEVILTDSGLTECTVTVTDADGNIPSNLHKKRKDGVTVADKVRVAVRSTDVSLSGVDTNDDAELDDEGMATFSVLLREDAREGSVTVFVSSSIGDEKLRASTSIMYGDPPTEPGMPMNVMAEATSHDMITVSWESPADDGGSAVTGYVLQSKTGTMDFMTIAASSAEVWWNTLDCPMMNAEIPDDATPAPPMDDTDMTSPYCAMYPGLSAEARIVVDKVFDDEYGTISGTSHSDMGLMAETTYYYRVSAINSVDQGEYSDGMAMATTMVTVVDAPPLGPASGLTATAKADGSVMLTWTTGTSATHHFVAGTDGAFDATGIKVWKFSSAMGTHTVSADLLTSGTVYDFYVISGQFEEQADGSWPGKWAAEGWSNAATATAN